MSQCAEFALHTRAILGLPIPTIKQLGQAASSVILLEGRSSIMRYTGLSNALAEENTDIRLFGKPEVEGKRRMGVALALAETIDEARAKALRVSSAVGVEY